LILPVVVYRCILQRQKIPHALWIADRRSNPNRPPWHRAQKLFALPDDVYPVSAGPSIGELQP